MLIDKYLMGTELEVDAICDGEDILIPGIMEHIERAGVHSGDSIAVYPAWNLQRRDHATRSSIAHRESGPGPEHPGPGQHPVSDLSKTSCMSSRSTPAPPAPFPISARSPACRWWTWPPGPCWAKSSRDMGYGTGLYPHAALCGGQGAGVLL